MHVLEALFVQNLDRETEDRFLEGVGGEDCLVTQDILLPISAVICLSLLKDYHHSVKE